MTIGMSSRNGALCPYPSTSPWMFQWVGIVSGRRGYATTDAASAATIRSNVMT